MKDFESFSLGKNLILPDKEEKSPGVTDSILERLWISFLEKTPNLTGDIKKQLEEYIKTLSSGASVSEEKYK